MAFVHGPMLKKTGVKSKELLHSTDWYPTLINLAGKKKREHDGRLLGLLLPFGS